MGDSRLRQLYMAKSMEQLNGMVSEIPSAAPHRLVKTAQRLLSEAQLVDKSRDEEKAYVFFMRYFSIVKTIQSNPKYKSEKKYFDMQLEPKVTARVITRAEELQKSLERRYDLINAALKAEKQEEQQALERLAQEKKEEEARRKARTTKQTPQANGSGPDC